MAGECLLDASKPCLLIQLESKPVTEVDEKRIASLIKNHGLTPEAAMICANCPRGIEKVEV